MSTLPALYPIVDSAAWVRRLTGLGVRMIQLRIKQATPDAIVGEVRAALAVCRAQGAQLVVNDHWQIARDEGADFIHLGQQDLATADLPAIRARGMQLGVSTHDRAELEHALAACPNYVALGPIYPTTLKAMPWAPQGLARIREWRRLVADVPLVAIGGITLERAKSCFDAGADSVAVVSDVCGHIDPAARVAAWIEATAAQA